MEANATALNNNSSSGLNTTTDAVVEEIDRELEGEDGENDNDGKFMFINEYTFPSLCLL